MKEKKDWSLNDAETMTKNFIDHIYEHYYRSYLLDSTRYERINNWLFTSVAIIGFLVTILLGIKEILKGQIGQTGDTTLTIIAFILPSLSSVLLLYWTQKGYKKKEEIREEARIECKYYVNEARIRFTRAKENPEELEKLYHWLNEKVRRLQQNQAKSYFSVHNLMERSNEPDS